MSNSIGTGEFTPRLSAWAVLGILAVLIGVVYGPAARAPFVHDDNIAVLSNPSIVRLWPVFGTADRPGPLNPPRDAVTSGRPLVNLSLALNYRLGGYDTLGYHLVNMMLHVLSATLLYGIVRRLLLLARFRVQFGTAATTLAIAVAVVWAIHPLVTDAVEYVSQRTELMVGMFYLATVYAGFRSITAESRPGRSVAATAATLACVAGMACKEVMVSAPLITLLFDGTFVSGSLRAALRKSWPLYAGLFGSWLVLLALNVDPPRSHAAGFQAGLPAYVWWFTQAKVLLLYLKLSIWPWPLIIHRETTLIWTLADALPWLLPAALAAGGTLFLLWRGNCIGFLGAWLFAILLPTMIMPMPSEAVAERRMYLPLAAVVALVILGGYAALRRQIQAGSPHASTSFYRSLPLRIAMCGAFSLTVVFAIVTSCRLEAYGDLITIWRDAVARQPENVRATINLGCVLQDAGRYQEAIEQFERAISIDPTRPDVGLAHRSLGLTWARLGQPAKAIDHLQLAMQLRPDVVKDHATLGSLLVDVHRFPDAVQQLELAVRQQPADVLALANLASAYANLGRGSDAVAAAEKARALASQLGAPDWVRQLDSWLTTYRGGLLRRQI
jgi:tetratricopeptide (TPR) repeat protein